MENPARLAEALETIAVEVLTDDGWCRWCSANHRTDCPTTIAAAALSYVEDVPGLTADERDFVAAFRGNPVFPGVAELVAIIDRLTESP
jgi:hypothetical protein